MDLSIVILTMNRPARCLETARAAALAAQGCKAEIIVVNNARATINLPREISGVSARELIMQKNLGAAARNHGWREARGRVALMLDDDANIAPGLPQALLKGLEEQPGAGALFFKVHDGKQEEGCLLPTVFHGCACGFRRDLLEKTGGYPAGFVYYGEEYDLTFRLYRVGQPPKLCEKAPAVHHARDPGGRNTARIIRFLVRNNTETWFAHLPFARAIQALNDTLRWYRLVGIKEQASEGFRQGCFEIPAALLRGLARRRPLAKEAFLAATLAGATAAAAKDMLARNLSKVILCGVGKFPSMWLAILKNAGLTPVAFMDRNPAWRGQSIMGVPIKVHQLDSWPEAASTCAWLTGTASYPDNRFWLNELAEKNLDKQTFLIQTPQ